MAGFEKVNSKVLSANLSQTGPVLARRGAMLFYTGDVHFAPATTGTGPGMAPPGATGMAGAMMGAAMRGMAGEHVQLMSANGQGTVNYGLGGLSVTLVQLAGQSLSVEASRLLAHTASLTSSVVSVAQSSGGGGGGGGLRGLMRQAAAGAATGQGMWTTQLTGHGDVALLSHGGTFELNVGPAGVVVDPQAYVGHLGNLQVQFTASVGWREAVGRGSGEATQLQITGQGVVYVQASEEKF